MNANPKPQRAPDDIAGAEKDAILRAQAEFPGLDPARALLGRENAGGLADQGGMKGEDPEVEDNQPYPRDLELADRGPDLEDETPDGLDETAEAVRAQAEDRPSGSRG